MRLSLGTRVPASPETSWLPKPLCTPGSARLQQPGEVDAEQGRVPAAGTAGWQGGFRCRCRARSSHSHPRIWGRKAFTCQDDGLNPARSYAHWRAMAGHWAALPGLTAVGIGDGSRRVGALPWPFSGAGPPSLYLGAELLSHRHSPSLLPPPTATSPFLSSGLTIFRLVQRKAWHSRFSLSWFWAM